MSRPQIVGWLLQRDESCIYCRKPATVLISEDGIDVLPHCNDCIPRGTPDPIAEVFAKAFASPKQIAE